MLKHFMICWVAISLWAGSAVAAGDRLFFLPSVSLLLEGDRCTEKIPCQAQDICAEPGVMALDNDCDGEVDEGCACQPGAWQSCFKGDPSYRFNDGCFAGTQVCQPSGQWGQCEGGLHATEACYDSGSGSCRALTGRPYVQLDLKPGTGSFSSDAIFESWEVACPAGIDPCPGVGGSAPADDFQPLVSGEYSVTYHKTTASGSDSCSYPLFIGAPGLRVELSWEWPVNQPDTVDLDLHLHKPGSSQPWGGDQGSADDCAWDNCTALDCPDGRCPEWFSASAPPAPVAWYLDPVLENNSCYFGPIYGTNWQSYGQGCHNPRMDADNISCDPSVSDPADNDFCFAENINIDFPPLRKWTRIGVQYYSSNGQSYPVHPEVRVYCDGRLAAALGPTGFNVPQAPVSFEPGDSGTLFWLVADVAFTSDACGQRRCVVEPIYDNKQLRTPMLSTVQGVQAAFGPAYPPLP